MDIRKLQRAIVDGLEDVKAHDIVVFDTEKLSPLFERVIIASGTSNRQTKALASSVRETVKKRGMRVLATEGEANGEWIIVDCGAAVAHIMQPSSREYYHLEEIWGGKPVRVKTPPVKRLPKASETAAAPAAQPAPAAPAAAGAAARTAIKGAAKKVVAKKAVATKAVATKAAAKEPVAGEAATKGAAPRKVAAKTAVARKAVAKSAPAKKALAQKAAAGKAVPNPAARKAPRG
jgi:ribosome-associated protein